MEASREGTTSSKDISKFKVDRLKKYLRKRGIQLSGGSEGKRKAELPDLCEKEAEMKQKKPEDSDEDFKNLLEDKLQTSEGYLPDTKTLTAWTYNFSNILEFTFRDLYNYLVSKEDYWTENLQ